MKTDRPGTTRYLFNVMLSNAGCPGLVPGWRAIFSYIRSIAPHPPARPFSPQCRLHWGEKGRAGGLGRHPVCSKKRAPPRHKTGAASNRAKHVHPETENLQVNMDCCAKISSHGDARLRVVVLLLPGLILGPSLAGGKVAASEESAWEKTGRFLYHEAVDEFSDLLASGRGRTSNLKFGLALNLINKQPKTQANLDRAESLFSEVYSAEGMEGLGIASKYYSGRIKEVHQRKPELAEAEKIYDQIIAANPRHYFAQLAATRYVLIRFYSVESLEERKDRFLDLEPLADNLIRPSIRSHFHSLMGDLAARYDFSLEKALLHYRESVAAGIQNFRIRRDVLVSIGEIARELGNVPLAVEYYERFLREFPRDRRRVLIQERLVALKSQLPKIP